MDRFLALFSLVPASSIPLDSGLPREPWLVLALFAALCGSCIGSFLNVCIYRIPLEQSVVHPGSHCMSCGAPIKWYHNIPIVSYFALRGKCAKCGAPFSFRYAAIELLVALLFVAVFCMWPPEDAATPPFGMRRLLLPSGSHGPIPWPPGVVFAYWLFLSGLVVGTFVDFDHYIIPDSVTIGGVVAGLVLSFLLPSLQLQIAVCADPSGGLSAFAALPGTRFAALARSAFGAAFGWVLVQAVRKGGTWWMRKRGRIGISEEAMGYGDVKLAAAIGAFMGWQAAAFALVAGSLFGSVSAVPALLSGRKGMLGRLPFGPWLSLGAAIWLFWGHRLVVAYITATAPWHVEVF